MLEIFSTLLTGALSGGATGLIGVVIQRFFDSKAKSQEIEIVKLNHAQTLALANIEAETAKTRANADMAVAASNAEAVEAKADDEAIVAALQADRASYLAADAQSRPDKAGAAAMLMMAFVDFIRGLVRPGMTLYLCILVSYMFVWAKDLASVHGVTLGANQINELIVQITTTILYVWSAISLYWFGTRPKTGK